MSLSYFRIANAIIIKPIFSSRLHATPKKPLIFNLTFFCELFCGIVHTAAQNDRKSLDKKLGQEGKIWVSDIRIFRGFTKFGIKVLCKLRQPAGQTQDNFNFGLSLLKF